MKTRPIRRTGGFTLIELLVVISIIAVLAGGGFAAGNAAIQKAKRTTAMATCIALELAINNFYTEYGTMPKNGLGENDPKEINTRDDLELLQVLLGLPEGDQLNPRRIKFLTVKQAKNGKDGLVYVGTTLKELVDPWGRPFFVRLDGNYDETLKVQSAGEQKETTLNGKRVAAWTNGADASETTGLGGKATDNVKTW